MISVNFEWRIKKKKGKGNNTPSAINHLTRATIHSVFSL
jgi:hypothetical protein